MVRLFLNGGGMSGGPLHGQLRGAPLLGPVRTASRYRFYSVRDEFPALDPAERDGVAVEGELYDVPEDVLRDSLLPAEPPELELGVVELAAGDRCFGFLLRPGERGRAGLVDISRFGGWRAYTAHGSGKGRLVLRGARSPGDVAVRDGWIVAVGDVAPEDGDTEIDCRGDVVTAGLVNTHHHLYQWMTRGRAVGCDLFGWLTELYPVWARLSPEDVRTAATVGLAELALSGCTTAADHHYVVPAGDDSVFDALADAARDVGIRLHLARGSMDLGESRGGLPPDAVVEDIDAILTSTEAVAGRLHDGERIVVTVAPCSPFSVSPELMRESAALARRHGLRLHTHLAETLDEERDCLERFGRRPVEVVDDLGWVASDVWFAHGIHLSGAEIRRLGEAGVGVAHCPSSNSRLAAGMCPVTDLRDAGVRVGLGVDGVASNEVGALFPELRQALYTARQRHGRPAAFLPRDALALATEGGAACLGRDDVGRLEPGCRADLVVWPGDDLADVPDPVDGLILGPDRRVRHVLVDGRFVVDGGRLVGADVGRLHRNLAERARRLWPRAGGGAGDRQRQGAQA